MLIADTEKNLQELPQKLAKKNLLNINSKKIECMPNSRRGGQ